jgi:tRNA(Ile)-lysidine synthase
MQTLGSVEKILDEWFSEMERHCGLDLRNNEHTPDCSGQTLCNSEHNSCHCGLNSQSPITLSIKKLKTIRHLELFLEMLLQPKNFPRSIISQISESVKSGTSGKIFHSQTHTVRRERNTLIIEVEEAGKDSSFADIPPLLNYNRQFFANINEVPKDSTIAVLSIDKIKEPLILRKWKEGDFFYPLGMNQKQKLSDFFNNNKFSSAQKANTWVLTHRGDIVWIVGHRIDDRYKLKFPKGAGTEAIVVTQGR